jgi:hypothetical protein
MIALEIIATNAYWPYSIWELLTPTHDAISSINLNLLMNLISVDVRYFQACVFKIFEDANWEVR